MEAIEFFFFFFYLYMLYDAAHQISTCLRDVRSAHKEQLMRPTCQAGYRIVPETVIDQARDAQTISIRRYIYVVSIEGKLTYISSHVEVWATLEVRP
jgi:hypothetical protein